MSKPKGTNNKPKGLPLREPENMVTAEFCYEQMVVLRGEIDIMKLENERLKEGLRRAIGTIEMECDDLDYINELKQFLKS